ncbi:Alpha-galactosidase [compost metagenome]
MLYYMPQTWTSDDTDAVERLKIQYGTSLVYPISSIGAHVSAVPNHQVHRMTSLKMRGDVAMSGNFGYELDLTKFTDDEKAIVKQQVNEYKAIRGLVQQGDLYRLLSPFEGNEASWMFVSTDRTEAVVYYFRVLATPHPPDKRLKLAGLDLDINYCIEGLDLESGFVESGTTWSGDRLMHMGIVLPSLQGDYVSTSFKLRAVQR